MWAIDPSSVIRMFPLWRSFIARTQHTIEYAANDPINRSLVHSNTSVSSFPKVAK